MRRPRRRGCRAAALARGARGGDRAVRVDLDGARDVDEHDAHSHRAVGERRDVADLAGVLGDHVGADPHPHGLQRGAG